MWLSKVKRLIVLIVALCGSSVLAQPTDVSVGVNFPNLTPANGYSVALIDNVNFTSYFATTDFLGRATFFGVEPGNYDLKLEPSFSSTASGAVDPALYKDSKFPVVVPVGPSVDLGFFTLSPFETILTINLSAKNSSPFAAAGAPIPGLVSLNGYGGIAETYRSIFVESTNSQLVLGFDINDNNDYDIFINTDNFTAFDFFFNPSKDPIVQNIELESPNETLTLNLVDSNSNPIFLGPNEFGNADCFSQGAANSYYATISGGSSSFSFVLPADSYTCNVYPGTFPYASISTTVDPGENKVVNVPLVAGDSDLTVDFIDESGLPFTFSDSMPNVTCTSVDQSVSQVGYGSTGSSSIPLLLPSGDFDCYPFVPGFAVDPFLANLQPAQSNFYTVTVRNASSTIKVDLFDGLSNPVFVPDSNSRIECSDQCTGSSISKIIDTGLSTITLSAVPGFYSCTAFISGYAISSTTVDATQTGTSSTAIYLTELSSTTTIFFDSPEGGPYIIPEGSFANLDCFQLDGSQGFSSPVAPGDNSGVIGLVEGSFVCSLYVDGNRVSEETLTVPPSGLDSFNMVVASADTQVAINLVNEQGLPITVPGGVFLQVDCQSLEGFSAFGSAGPGESAVFLSVVNDIYQCNFYGEGVFAETFSLDTSVSNSTFIYPQFGTNKLDVNLVNGNTGQPLVIGAAQFGSINCSENTLGGIFSGEISPNSSTGAILLAPGSYNCEIFVESYSSQAFQVQIQQGVPVTQAITLFPPDSSIRIELVNTNDNSSFSLPPNTLGGVGCQNLNSGDWFSGFLNPGDSASLINVREGNYLCEVWIDNFGSPSIEVAVLKGQTSTAQASVFGRTAKLAVRILDSTTNTPITDQDFEVFIGIANPIGSTGSLNDFSYAAGGTGEFLFDVLPGQNYEVSVSRPFDENSSKYVLTDDIVVVTTSQTETKTVDLFAVPSTTFFTVTVTDPSGNLVQNGWVDAFSQASTSPVPGTRFAPISAKPRSTRKSDPSEAHWAGGPIIDGRAKLAVLPGRTYEVSVFPDYGLKAAKVPPPTQRVLAQPNVDTPLNFQFASPNYQLEIALKSNSAPPAGDPNTHCFVIDNEGRQSYTDGLGVGPLTVNLLIDTAQPVVLQVGCSAYYTGTDGAIFFGERLFSPSIESQRGKIEVVISEQGEFFPQETSSFTATQTVSFTLPDKRSTIDIPADAISKDGKATLVVNTATGVSFENRNFPLLAFDIKFVQGEKNISTTSKPITIRFPIDIEKLKELGGDINSITVGSFEKNSKVWRRDANFVFDPTTNTVTLTVSHFSIWGVLIDLSKKVTASTPFNLRASKSNSQEETSKPEKKKETKKKKKQNNKKKKKNAKRSTSKKKKNRKRRKRNTELKVRYDLCWESPSETGTEESFTIQLVTPNQEPNSVIEPEETPREKKNNKTKKSKKKKKASKKKKSKKKQTASKRPKRKKRGKRRTKGKTRLQSNDPAWATAEQITSSDTCITRTFKNLGEHTFRVSISGQNYSKPLTFEVSP